MFMCCRASCPRLCPPSPFGALPTPPPPPGHWLMRSWALQLGSAPHAVTCFVLPRHSSPAQAIWPDPVSPLQGMESGDSLWTQRPTVWKPSALFPADAIYSMCTYCVSDAALGPVTSDASFLLSGKLRAAEGTGRKPANAWIHWAHVISASWLFTGFCERAAGVGEGLSKEVTFRLR